MEVSSSLNHFPANDRRDERDPGALLLVPDRPSPLAPQNVMLNKKYKGVFFLKVLDGRHALLPSSSPYLSCSKYKHL